MMTLAPFLRLAARCVPPAAGILGLGAAQAADLPLRSSLPPMEALPLPAPPPVWGGFHVGLDGGYVRTGSQKLRTTGTTPGEQALIDFGNIGVVTVASSSFVLRGGFGYDVQLTPGSGFVAGLVTDALYTELERTRTSAFRFITDDITVVARQRLDFLGTVRGRLGYAFGPVLAYGTGGFAYGGVGVSAKTDLSTFGYTGIYDGGRSRGIDTGFVYGGGIEIMVPEGFAPGVIAPGRLAFKVEYLRYDLGQRTVALSGLGPVFGPGGPRAVGHTANSVARTEGQFVTAGLTYRFPGLGY